MQERRVLAAELRAVGIQGGPRRLSGYAARFGVRANLGGFTEEIAHGAFMASLRDNPDVVAMVDHDPSKVLGRTKSGSLALLEDGDGLRFDLALPETSAARDVIALAERGDIGGCSFGFNVAPGGDSWQGTHRTLRAIQLAEISIVSAWPAYAGTSVIVRARVPESAPANWRRRFLETI